MIIEALKKKQLAEWVNNYVCNKDLPFVTNSATITDYELTGIAEKMKALGANGIRIYFIRFKENDPNYEVYTGPPPNDQIAFVGRQLTQVSIAIVPTYSDDPSRKTPPDDVKNTDNTFTVLVPAGGENSGLCPPNCKR